MRVLLVLALTLFLAGAASAGSARHTSPSPLSVGSFSELSGAAATTIGGGKDGQLVRFLPNAKFALGILLQNTSRRTALVTRARVLEPRRTLIRQTGARFHAWSPPTCPPGARCPARTFPIGSGAAHHPHPVAVEPGGYVGVELDFRLGSCPDVPGANAAPVSRLRVTFRMDGPLRQHVLALGGDSLRLRMPQPEDCATPRSTLFVNDPSHIGTSYYFTLPGSKGDVCTRRAGELVFRSRAMKNNDGVAERLEIRVPSFAGRGTYHNATAAAVVGGKPVFHTPALVTVTKASSREVFAKVHAHRISGWMRCRVSG
jgi:hypothetical protein